MQRHQRRPDAGHDVQPPRVPPLVQPLVEVGDDKGAEGEGEADGGEASCSTVPGMVGTPSLPVRPGMTTSCQGSGFFRIFDRLLQNCRILLPSPT